MTRSSSRSALPGFVLSIAFLPAAAVGCGGDDGTDAIVDFSRVAAGDECANGGIRVSTGTDDNGNGKLDEDEVTRTRYICSGSPGEAGETGPAGDSGVIGETGPSGNSGETGEEGVVGTDGPAGEEAYQLLTDSTDIPIGDPSCPNGGVRITVGLDNGDGGGKAGDGKLQNGEVDDAVDICKGATPYANEQVTPPGGPIGNDTIIGDGGDTTAGGSGGDGGYLRVDLSHGSSGGHVKLFRTGAADASFEVPGTTAYLGAEPVDFTEDAEVEVRLADDHDAMSDGTVHQHRDSNELFIADASQPTGHRTVTGIHVATGVTVILGINFADGHGLVALDLANDIHNEGTITVPPKVIKPAKHGSDLRLSCVNYFGGRDSTIALSGKGMSDQVGGNGGFLELTAVNGNLSVSNPVGSIYNRGAIDTSGGSGLDGGAGGHVLLQAYLAVYNTGGISSSGGEDISDSASDGGTGGSAGYIHFAARFDDIANSGSLRARGGNGFTSGGAGSHVLFESSKGGGNRLLNSGSIVVGGGDADPGCVIDCSGGDAGHVEAEIRGGDIVNTGNVNARGGFGGADAAGAGGYVELNAHPGTGWYGGYLPTGSIYVSGKLDVSGGDGLVGGAGGHVEVTCNASDTPLNQEIVFFGYDFFRFNGGTGSRSAGNGGHVELYHRNTSSTENLYVSPRGGIFNHVDVRANAGGGADFAAGGHFVAVAQPKYPHPLDSAVVRNYGDVALNGGQGVVFGGAGGYFRISGPNGAANHGTITATGGDSTDDAGAGGGRVSSPSFLVNADLGKAVNTGGVDISGGAGAGDKGEGGEGGRAELSGASVENVGDLVCAGGDAHAATGLGGPGGVVFLYGTQSESQNSGTLYIRGGKAKTDGDDGMVVIDGMNRTNDFI
jgi:hypothetical protein